MKPNAASMISDGWSVAAIERLEATLSAIGTHGPERWRPERINPESRHVIISNHPTLVFQAAELPNVLSRELQSDARSKTIALSDEKHTEILECSHQCLSITASRKPGTAARLQTLECFNRNSRNVRETSSADPGQCASG